MEMIFDLPALPLAACATPTASTTVTLRATLQHICRLGLFLSWEGLLLPGKLAVSKLFQIISGGSPHHATYHHDINLWDKIKNPQKSLWEKRQQIIGTSHNDHPQPPLLHLTHLWKDQPPLFPSMPSQIDQIDHLSFSFFCFHTHFVIFYELFLLS